MRAQQIMRQQQIVLVPLANADAVYAQEFAKGEASAFSTLMALPQAMIESLQVSINQQQEQEDAN